MKHFKIYNRKTQELLYECFPQSVAVLRILCSVVYKVAGEKIHGEFFETEEEAKAYGLAESKRLADLLAEFFEETHEKTLRTLNDVSL